MLLSALMGAVAVERLTQKDKRLALKAGWRVFTGTFRGAALKVGVSGIMAYYFIRGDW